MPVAPEDIEPWRYSVCWMLKRHAELQLVGEVADLKVDAGSELQRAIEAVLQGEQYVSSGLVDCMDADGRFQILVNYLQFRFRHSKLRQAAV